jgi:sulfide dehydrogenase [flavocytochrome c] flavoprotein subunit
MRRRAFLDLGLAGLSLSVLGCKRQARAGLAKAHVIVVGGGFGGLNAAKALKRLAPELAVTLIEPNPRPFACPGSNAVIAGLQPMDTLQHDPSPSLNALNIRTLTARVAAIDNLNRRLTLNDDATLTYDRLIVSPGVEFDWEALEGYDESASLMAPHAWKAGEQTLLLQRQLQSLRPGGTVIIAVPDNPYRCPPGPYERACLMAHYLKRHNPRAKVLILDAKTRFSKQAAFTEAWRTLYPGMIEWISSETTGRIDHVDVNQRSIQTEFASHRADILNVIPPQRAGRLAALAGLADGSGWCPVDPLTFESTRQSGIHVIGDASAALPMPKSAFAAQNQARLCAAAIIDLLQDRPPVTPRLINHCYSFVSPNQAISITAVYGYEGSSKSLSNLSGGETGPADDWRREATFATDWYHLLMEDTFGHGPSGI